MSSVPHPVRGLFVALSLATLAACGGDDSSDAPAGSIQDAAAVRWHLALAMSQVPLPGADRHGVPAALLDPLEPLDSSACPGGGTANPTMVIRGTPYNFLPLFARRVQYQECVLHYGPSANPTEATLTAHGIEESAQVNATGGAVIGYVQSGNADGSAPMERRFRAVASGGNREEDHRLAGRSDTYTLRNGSTLEYQATLVRSHTLDIRFPGVATYAGTYRLGSVAAPFRVTSSNNVTQLAGEYEIDTARCQSGAMHIATLEGLVFDPAKGSVVAGTLEFTGTAGTARATFREDGRVTLRGADGGERVEDFVPQTLPWGGSCFGSAR